MKKFGLVLIFALIALLPAAFAQDPTKLRPEQYKIEAQNEFVRIIRVVRQPHEMAPMHEHPPGVVIFLQDMHQKITNPEGKVNEARQKAGNVVFNGPNKHQEESLDEPMESMLIELQPAALNGPPTPPIPHDMDATVADAAHTKVEIDNEWVRVLRVKRGPNESAPMHSHPYYIAVFMSEVHQTVTNAAGQVNQVNRKRGEFAVNKPNTHKEQNGDQAMESLIIELKKANPSGQQSLLTPAQ